MRVFFYALMSLIAAPASAGEVPFHTQSGGYRIVWAPDVQTLEIRHTSADTDRFDVTGCVFGRRVSGVFALYFVGTDEAFVAQHCQTEGGDRISIYAPERDKRHPVFELYADRINYRIHPDRIAISSRVEGRGFELDWAPEAPQAQPRKNVGLWKNTIAELPETLLPRQLGLAKLDRDLRDPARRTELVGEEASWLGWERLLKGGWTLEKTESGGQRAILPAEAASWPNDVDPDSHVYGDLPGARLLAAPHSSAPALFPIHRKILRRGPEVGESDTLASAGWAYLCAGEAGCGFARLGAVRSPNGPRASFVRSGSGAPWRLEALARE